MLLYICISIDIIYGQQANVWNAICMLSLPAQAADNCIYYGTIATATEATFDVYTLSPIYRTNQKIVL